MRLKNDGAESKGVFVAKGSWAAIIKIGRASFSQHIATSVVITLRAGWGWKGIIELETDGGLGRDTVTRTEVHVKAWK